MILRLELNVNRSNVIVFICGKVSFLRSRSNELRSVISVDVTGSRAVNLLGRRFLSEFFLFFYVPRPRSRSRYRGTVNASRGRGFVSRLALLSYYMRHGCTLIARSISRYRKLSCVIIAVISRSVETPNIPTKTTT